MANLPQVDDSRLESDVIQSPIPVLLNFGSTWCDPCRKLAPIVEKIARDYAGRLRVAYVDVEAAPETATRFGVLHLPTVVLVKDGRVTETLTGLQSRATLDKSIERLLA